MLHHLVLYEEWVEPGVSAFDDLDGDLSGAITSYGNARVDTALATSDDAPYIVTYEVG